MQTMSSSWRLWRRVHIESLIRQFSSFLAVGVVNTAFGYSVFAAVFFVTGSHRIAIVTATVVGVIFNFFTMQRFVFERTTSWGFLRFVAVYAAICWVNVILVDIAVAHNMTALLAQLAALTIIVPLTFGANKLLVFRGNR
jgi:putative flippase GtrA